MNDRRQEFKKWLIDSMKRDSSLSYAQIALEVGAYSKTPEFEKAYERWRRKFVKLKKFSGVKHISEIIETM